jgi:hypothetical protein
MGDMTTVTSTLNLIETRNAAGTVNCNFEFETYW